MNNQHLATIVLLLAVCLTAVANAQIPITAQATTTFAEPESAGAVQVSGRVTLLNDSPAENVELRFWQPDRPAEILKTRTNQQGEYSIGLGDGLWQGAACGSASGYRPARWRVGIAENAVSFLRAQEVPELRLDSAVSDNINISALNSARQGDQVTLSGSGFGCSGKLRFIYRNQVSHISGLPLEAEYGVADVVIDNLDSGARSDVSLTFFMPALRNLTAHKHVAQLVYEQGGKRSNALVFTQQMFEIVDDDVTTAGDRIGDNPAIDFSPNVVVLQEFDQTGAQVVQTGTPAALGSIVSVQGNPALGAEPELEMSGAQSPGVSLNRSVGTDRELRNRVDSSALEVLQR